MDVWPLAMVAASGGGLAFVAELGGIRGSAYDGEPGSGEEGLESGLHLYLSKLPFARSWNGFKT
jgi:hypothetical protein